jgi:hypothetical protein
MAAPLEVVAVDEASSGKRNVKRLTTFAPTGGLRIVFKVRELDACRTP